MEGPVSFFLFYFLVVPFVLMNFTAYRKERRTADEELQAILRENNNLLKEFLSQKKHS